MPNSRHPTAPPSLYPDPLIPTRPPPQPPAPSPPEELPPSYEVLIELLGRLTELQQRPNTPPLTAEGTLRVLQGTAPPEDLPPDQHDVAPPYYAFLSLQYINIPLLPTHVASSTGTPARPAFQLSIPGHTFAITLSERTEPELTDGFQRILQWFCKWQSDSQEPDGTAPPDASGPPPTHSEAAMHRAGDKGVKLVERIGTRINSSISRRMSRQVETARAAGDPKDVKLGGAATSKTLSGTRTVVGAGASVAASASDKISDVLGRGIANNPISKNMREAPRGTKKRAFYDHLMGGLMTVGRVYVEADKQGKIIIENAGNGAAEYTGAKYGPEAEYATRQVGGIALGGYRIMRFPQKLGATALVKGALKSQVNQHGPQNMPSSSANAEPHASQPYASAQTSTQSYATAQPYVSEANYASATPHSPTHRRRK